MRRKGDFVLGSMLVIIGVLLFAARLEFFDMGHILSNYWAIIFIALPGLFFHFAFFQGGKKSPGLLVPGGILFFTGIVCQLSYSFSAWRILWPGFIMSVALALYELYLFGKRDRGLLIPIAILGGLSLVFFTTFSLEGLVGYSIRKLILPGFFIVSGLAIIFGNRRGE